MSSSIKHIYREAEKPEPIENINRKGWIDWGEKNLHPQFLVQIYQDNPVHGGIINQKVKFITAGGLEVEGADAAILDNGTAPYNLQELYEMFSLDFEIFEAWAVLFKKDSSGQWLAHACDMELLRATDNGVVWKYSENWANGSQNDDTGYREIKSIHFVDLEQDSECVMVSMSRPKQRLFEETGKLSANYYPTPTYSGAITDILAGIEMSYFTYSEVVNGWKGGTLINLSNGIPEPEQQRKIDKELKGAASNRKTQGGLAITHSDGKERAPEVHQISGNDLDKRYEQAKKACRDAVMVAHGVISPALFGVFSESMFGSKEEMETAYLLFKENYVEARQRQLLQPLTWAFMLLNGFTGKLIAKDYVPAVVSSIQKADPLPQPAAFANDEPSRVILEFAKRGRAKSEFTAVQRSEYRSYEDNEGEVKSTYLKTLFADDLTDQQTAILQMISNGESYDAIRRALKISGRELSRELIRLGDMGLLDGWEVTERGRGATTSPEQIEILYSYELRDDAPPLKPGGESRQFCQELIALDRLYTRQEIEQISAAVDRDVWRYRGGWYHNSQTGRNTPSCRHSWYQNVIIK